MINMLKLMLVLTILPACKSVDVQDLGKTQCKGNIEGPIRIEAIVPTKRPIICSAEDAKVFSAMVFELALAKNEPAVRCLIDEVERSCTEDNGSFVCHVSHPILSKQPELQDLMTSYVRKSDPEDCE